MVVISKKEFRSNENKYFDLVNKNEQVIVQRSKKKAYTLTAISDDDIYFSDPEIKARINRAIQQVDNGEGIIVTNGNQRNFLGIE
jgi:hypothetical protein